VQPQPDVERDPYPFVQMSHLLQQQQQQPPLATTEISPALLAQQFAQFQPQQMHQLQQQHSGLSPMVNPIQPLHAMPLPPSFPQQANSRLHDVRLRMAFADSQNALNDERRTNRVNQVLMENMMRTQGGGFWLIQHIRYMYSA
jgi:hypothetical protein